MHYFGNQMALRTKSFSVRWQVDVLDRLQRRSKLAGTSRSRLAERYVDEGTRMDDHPGIVFRDGPTGRRAALVAGPDVWEVLEPYILAGKDWPTLRESYPHLDEAVLHTALRYYESYPEEIEARVALNQGV